MKSPEDELDELMDEAITKAPEIRPRRRATLRRGRRINRLMPWDPEYVAPALPVIRSRGLGWSHGSNKVADHDSNW